MRRTWIVACVSALSCGPAEVTPECPGERMVLGADTLRAAASIETDCLVIPAGVTAHIEASRTTVVRARAVMIGGEATVAGPGTGGPTNPAWISSGSCVTAHFDWEDAVRSAPRRESTLPGGAGGTFVLRYGRIVGGPSRLDLLRFELPGGPGGRGRELRCGCPGADHALHVARAADGEPGPPGTWRFIQEDL